MSWLHAAIDVPADLHTRVADFGRGCWGGNRDVPGPTTRGCAASRRSRGGRAHLDLGTDDLLAEVRRLVGLGAQDRTGGRGRTGRGLAGRWSRCYKTCIQQFSYTRVLARGFVLGSVRHGTEQRP